MRTMTRLAIFIDGEGPFAGDLEQHRDVETVSTMCPAPDPKWEQVDSNGHYHARNADEDDYPTLKIHVERVECDGSCGGVCEGEGFTVTHYHCQVCDEEIEPGTIPGPHVLSMPGLASWQVTVRSTRTLDGTVSVRVVANESTTLFGVATASGWESDGFGLVTTTLVGVSPLGRRQA